MDTDGPSIASGGMIAFTRLPSFRRASTMGQTSSQRRPSGDTILSIKCSRCALSLNFTPVNVSRPPFSMYTCLGPLIRMSEICSSASSGSSGPSPNVSSRISRASRCRSLKFSSVFDSSHKATTIWRTCSRISSVTFWASLVMSSCSTSLR